MALFAIRRNVEGLTREDIDAAAFRALTCIPDYDGMRWVTSYWSEEREELLCMYEARSIDDIQSHARRARIPCDDVTEVTSISPDEYTTPEGTLERDDAVATA